MPGRRRYPRLPNPCCDTPTPATAGVMAFDEIEVWTGRLDRFDWKLIGKKEIYIPYNGNRFLQPKTDAEVVTKNHLNPDHVRWELHRVWVVEAALRAGHARGRVISGGLSAAGEGHEKGQQEPGAHASW